MTRENFHRAMASAESVTEKWLLMRVAMPPPFTFIIEAVYFALALYGAWRMFW